MVIGIEADDFRILNDQGRPYLYPSRLFKIVDSHEPVSWITELGDDDERYAYPPLLNGFGFFEDFFDDKKSGCDFLASCQSKSGCGNGDKPVFSQEIIATKENENGFNFDAAARHLTGHFASGRVANR